jgi:hypothetical protein
MKRQKRVTRPSLERDTPLRSWETLFGPSGSPGDGKGARGVGVDAVQRGVEFAYRVSDEYLRQGQSFARAFTQPFSPAPGGGPANALPQLTERMMRYGSELSSMMSNGASPPSSGFPADGFPSPFATAPTAHPGHDSVSAPPADTRRDDSVAAAAQRISIQVDSKLRARAAVELRGRPGADIVVGPLLQEGGKSRISDVKLERDDDDGGRVVVVRVSARQPPGKYVADILDATAGAKPGTSVGTVTVRLSR